MRKRAATTLALATLLALILPGPTKASPVVLVRNLSPGCNMVTATFPTGTQTSTLADFVSPPSALQAVWRVDNATRTFQAFMPQAPQASDLTSLNLLDPLFVCVNAAATVSLPTPNLDPESPPISVSLSTGCNAVGLTFSDPEGVTPSDVADAVTPAGALQSIWRLDNATGGFQAYVAAAPQASDLTSLQFLDAVFVCAGGPATLSMPAVTEPAGGAVQPPATPSAGGEEAVRYLMEGAVPQAVDLPQGFVVLDEQFDAHDPSAAQPGLLYSYDITYGNISALVEGPPETLFYAEFAVVLFDTPSHAQGLLDVIASFSAEDFKRLWRSGLSPVGLELGSLTIEEVEHLTTIGEEASLFRVRMQLRPAGTSEGFRNVVTELLAFRRSSVVGEAIGIWTEAPPAQGSVTENLAKELDAGIRAVLSQLQAAVP
jgi:hypothetical protein